MKRKFLTNMYMSSLCLELSMLIHAGFTIPHGIELMLEDESNKDSRMVLLSLRDNLSGGVPLSEAMNIAGYFPLYMVNMVRVGEKTGHLSDTLKALSEYYERREMLAISIKNATTYPAILLTMMLAVVVILIVQVLPIFNDVFGSMGVQMSPFALQLMQFGVWLKGASVVIVLTFGVLFLMMFLAWAISGIRKHITRVFRDNFGDKWVFGRIASSQFTSSMALAMVSGMDVEDSVSLAASLNSDSKVLNHKYEKCKSLLTVNINLANALRDSQILSAKDSRMLSIGEQSGMGDATMVEIARRTDRFVQDEISRVVGRIEPTLVIITSIIVGIILLSVMLPLMGIMTSVG